MGLYNKILDSIFPSIWEKTERANSESANWLEAIFRYIGPQLTERDGTSYLQSSLPVGANHNVQQVKASGFLGAGSATVTGLLTTDTITASGTAPTCTVDGTLTFGADCWDVYVHRSGVLWAYLPGINVGETAELDASGNGNHLTALTTTVVTERTDGSGTDYCNDEGFSERENLVKYSNTYSTFWTLQSGSISTPIDWYNSISQAVAYGAPLYSPAITTLTTGSDYTVIANVRPHDETEVVYLAATDSSFGEISRSSLLVHTGADMLRPIKTHFTSPAGGTRIVIKKAGGGENGLDVGEIKIVSFVEDSVLSAGDSIAYGAQNDFGTSAIYGYADMFSAFRNINHKSIAVGGYTLSEIHADLATELAIKDYPLILLEGGLNDMYQADVSPVSAMLATKSDSIDLAKLHSDKVVCINCTQGVLAGDRLTWLSEYNSELLDLCVEKDVQHIDFHSLLDSDRELYYGADQTHPNIIGHTAAADLLVGEITLPSTCLFYSNYVETTTDPITGRQPADFQSFTDNAGPLGRDFPIVSGDTYPNVSVKAPLGAMFQGKEEWTGEVQRYLPDLSTNTDNDTFITDQGIAIFSEAQTDTEAKKVLSYLKEPFWSDGLVSALDVFNASINRGVVLTTSYASGTYEDRMSSKGLNIGPAVTELFGVAPDAPAIKTLTAQAYCLQVLDGSATCSYGTATPTAPLQFTAIAEDVTFTPINCTLWNLTADGGYVFDLLKHGETRASSAATSGGNGAGLEMDAKILGALAGIDGADATCTVLNEMYMGVGSGELVAATDYNAISWNDNTGRYKFTSTQIIRAYDGSVATGIAGTWNRNEIHKRVVQANASGYRVGYRRFESDGITPITDWIWSGYSAFDGSFDPLDWLRFGYLNTVPMWLRKNHIWTRGDVTEAELDAPLEVTV